MSKDRITNNGLVNRFMANYFIMIKHFFQLILVLFAVILGILLLSHKGAKNADHIPPEHYWMLLHRKSNIEYLYRGAPGEKERSRLIKTFVVKSGIPGERPTPLPQVMGREYWQIIGKVETKDNPETAPYFLILDIPYSENYPFGPSPYLECGGEQCDWIVPGSFGLHGINGDPMRLSIDNPGSSGCVRHADEDITYLYNLLKPEKERIRYYIKDI